MYKKNPNLSFYNCNYCKKTKPAEEFFPHVRYDCGKGYCKACIRQKVLDKSRTRVGLIKGIYLSQKRTNQERGFGEIGYSLKELIVWISHKKNIFNKLFKNWESSNYGRWKRPSIDRISDDRGYALENIQLCTWKFNSMKESKKHNKRILAIYPNGDTKEFGSVKEAAKYIGCAKCSISNSIRTGHKCYGFLFKFQFALKGV